MSPCNASPPCQIRAAGCWSAPSGTGWDRVPSRAAIVDREPGGHRCSTRRMDAIGILVQVSNSAPGVITYSRESVLPELGGRLRIAKQGTHGSSQRPNVLWIHDQRVDSVRYKFSRSSMRCNDQRSTGSPRLEHHD